MKDVRFYLEFPTKQAKRKSGRGNVGHSGNVFAAFPALRWTMTGFLYDGMGAVFERPNSPVEGTSASVDKFIQPLCKRVSERVARVVHPQLFDRLDRSN